MKWPLEVGSIPLIVSVNATSTSGGLRDQRRAAGLSQQRLAELAGCSVSAVRLLERGYQPDPSAVLERVAAILNEKRPAAEPGASTTSARQGRHGAAYP